MERAFRFLEGTGIYDAVMTGGMLKAERSVDVATANVKDIRVPGAGRGRRAPGIVKVFLDLARRGVAVRLLHSGVPSASFIGSLKKHGLCREPNFTMRRCVRVHFKCVIIDAERVYLGSANLTGAGFGAKGRNRRNFETGVLTSDPVFVERTLELFNEVFTGERCTACDRKDVCYVPLEEPDF